MFLETRESCSCSPLLHDFALGYPPSPPAGAHKTRARLSAETHDPASALLNLQPVTLRLSVFP